MLKPGPLTDPERLEMQQHTRLGGRIVGTVPHLKGLAQEIISCHHERWDGSGYPDGLAGDAIPLAARVFAIADGFDAMTHDRPYRAARTREEAVAEIRAQAGRQFDPEPTRVFVELMGAD